MNTLLYFLLSVYEKLCSVFNSAKQILYISPVLNFQLSVLKIASYTDIYV